MDNASQLIENINSACVTMAGNIDRFLPEESRLIGRFVNVVSKVAVMVDRCKDSDGIPRNYAGTFRALGRSTGKLMLAYHISQSLGKSYHLAFRGRLTEYGSNPDRVQLEESSSKIITMQDLQLVRPLELTIGILVTEADREISAALQATAPYALGT